MYRSSILLILIYNLGFGQKTEKFSDWKNTVKPNLYKIDVTQNNKVKEAIVTFDLFKKAKNKWIRIQNLSFKKQAQSSLSVTTDEDLNNDGYNDLKISYAQAGRGSNSSEKLFIFNPKLYSFIEIVNSQEYPNLHYNQKRDCINSFSFYGGNSTYFLRMDKNKLKTFARLDYYNDTVTSYHIKNGQDILLKKIPYKTEDAAVFFSDFDPIEE